MVTPYLDRVAALTGGRVSLLPRTRSRFEPPAVMPGTGSDDAASRARNSESPRPDLEAHATAAEMTTPARLTRPADPLATADGNSGASRHPADDAGTGPRSTVGAVRPGTRLLADLPPEQAGSASPGWAPTSGHGAATHGDATIPRKSGPASVHKGGPVREPRGTNEPGPGPVGRPEHDDTAMSTVAADAPDARPYPV